MIESKLGRLQQAAEDVFVDLAILHAVAHQLAHRSAFFRGRFAAQRPQEEFFDELVRGLPGCQQFRNDTAAADSAVDGVADQQMQSL